MKFRYVIASLLVIVASSCTTVQHISKSNVSYDVPSKQSNPATDAAITGMITPYKIQLDSQMNVVLGNVASDLTKKQPESAMGNWVTDAMMEGVLRAGYTADFAVNNYGGMRVPVITAGPLTMGEVYELSPFDNTIMIVDVPGTIVDSLFEFIAERDGWPVSGQIRMLIGDKKLVSATIDDKPIMANKIYKVVLPDYVANGGDDARFMMGLTKVQTGLLLRNVIVDHAKETTANGNDIKVELQGRIRKQ